MILTVTYGSSATAALSLDAFRKLLTDAARAGVDAALFVRSAGQATPMLDAVPLIAALASVPVDIGLGASIPLDYTEPFHLARAFAAIDRLTKGRSAVVIDVAAGDDLAAPIGHATPSAERALRNSECLDVTTKLWDSWEDSALLVDRSAGLFTDPDRIHRVNHDGRFFAVRGPLNAPRPLQGWPVIIVPVRCVVSLRLAAQWADVALIAGSSADEVHNVGTALRKKAAALGRAATSIRVLADVEPGQLDAAHMRDWHGSGVCDGFNLVISAASSLDSAVAPGLGRTLVQDGGTLRARLGLPRSLSQYAAA